MYVQKLRIQIFRFQMSCYIAHMQKSESGFSSDEKHPQNVYKQVPQNRERNYLYLVHSGVEWSGVE